jgi:uncharacterized protein
MSDPHGPPNSGQAEEPVSTAVDADLSGEYDHPYTGVLPGTALPFRPWPGWLRAFLFFTAASIVSSLGSGLGVALAAALTGQRIPTAGPDLATEIFTRPALVFGSGLLSLVLLLGLTQLCARAWDRRSLASVGLQWDGAALRQFGTGLALGAALMASVFAAEAALGWLQVQTVMPAPRWPGYVLLWLIALLPAAAYEEVMLRGYPFQALQQQWGGAAATLITAVVFAALHGLNPNAGWGSFGGILTSGILFGIAYLVTRRLWLPIGLHIGWNLFEGPVLGFPLSGIDFPSAVEPVVHGPALWTGGSFGPEAGLLGLLANALGAVVLVLLRRQLRPVSAHPPAAPP